MKEHPRPVLIGSLQQMEIDKPPPTNNKQKSEFKIIIIKL